MLRMLPQDEGGQTRPIVFSLEASEDEVMARRDRIRNHEEEDV